MRAASHIDGALSILTGRLREQVDSYWTGCEGERRFRGVNVEYIGGTSVPAMKY
jgi:hypothetical protein